MKPAFAILFCLTTFLSVSQELAENHDDLPELIQSNRIELGIVSGHQTYSVVNAKERGLILFKKTKGRGKGGYYWEFNHLDTLLSIKWTKQHVLPYGSILLEERYKKGVVYLLSGIPDRDDFYKRMQLLIIRPELNELIAHEINLGFPFRLQKFALLQNFVALGGQLNNRTTIILHDIDKGSNKVVPGFHQKGMQLLDLQVTNDYSLLGVVMTEKGDTKSQFMTVRKINESGEQVSSYSLDPQDGRNLSYNKFISLPGGEEYIIGTYLTRGFRNDHGIFIAKYVQQELAFMKYWNSIMLNNQSFPSNIDMVPDEVTDGARQNGKTVQPLRNSRFFVQDLIQVGGRTCLIAEAYKREHSRTAYAQPGASDAFDRSSHVKDGYKYMYEHGIIIAFDQGGEITWGNHLVIDDLESYRQRSYTKIIPNGSRMALSYANKGTLRYKIIDMKVDVREKTYVPVVLRFGDDVLYDQKEGIGGLEYWYRDKLYLHGYQTITSRGGNNIREVYYVNKVAFD